MGSPAAVKLVRF